MGRSLRKYALTLLICILWAGAVCYSYDSMMKFETTPGIPGQAPRHWPNKILPPNSDKPTLIMLVHPNCSCSKASLDELEQLMVELQDYIDARILFIVPPNLDASDLTTTALWKHARTIPGAQSIVDDSGILAKRFRAFTSGQTFIYSSGGDLIFSGGITLARGHSGAGPGSAAIRDLVTTHKTERSTFSVFGCNLF